MPKSDRKRSQSFSGTPRFKRLFAAAILAAALACDRERESQPSSGAVRSVDTPARSAQSARPEQPARSAQPARKRISEAGLAKIREREAFVPRVYDDGSGNAVIGYGHLVLAGEDFSSGITEAEAMKLFEKDVERVVNVSLDKIQNELTQDQIDSIGSLIFKAGPGAVDKQRK